MSWEDQGRQFHQWFGHGTAGEVGAAAPVDATGAIGAEAVAALGPVCGASLSRVLAEGGAKDLATALPIWVSSAGLAPGQFRALLVGKGLGAGAAASLQAMARASRDGDVKAAGEHLAAALAGEREGRLAVWAELHAGQGGVCGRERAGAIRFAHDHEPAVS